MLSRFSAWGLTLALVCGSFAPILIDEPAEALAQSTVASLYLDAPFVQGSYAVNHGGVTETFNSIGTGSFTVNSGTSLTFGTANTVGTTSNTFLTFGGDVYGASSTSDSATIGGTATRHGAVSSGTNFTISFTTPVKYIGFHWNAGDAGNQVTFYRNNNEVATMTTADVQNTVGTNPSATYASNSDSITANSGSSYFKKYYWGPPSRHSSMQPTTCPFSCEPFAYVHAFASNGQSFDSIKFAASGGGGFEFDNLTVSTQDVPIRDSLVFVSEVSSSCTVASNNDGNGVTTLRYTGTSLCTFTPPAGVTTISIIAVAGGGGGGGGCVGGGGGAGGFFRNTNLSVNGNIDINIGSGGSAGTFAGSCNASRGGTGGDTTLTISGIITRINGGGGGGAFNAAKTGANGGSGGGGSGDSSITNAGGTGIAGQGNNGGVGRALAPSNPGGGGGGYTTAGDSGTATAGGAGGSGISITVFGASQNFSGGGGGASDQGGGTGGQSCGGNGGGVGGRASAASGFGCGGGGGTGGNVASAGSAGVVFISYVRVTSISWSIGGTTGSGSITEISWTSMQATSRNSLTIKRTLVSEATTKTPGTMVILQAPLDDSAGVSCGSYTSYVPFTLSNGVSRTFTVSDAGSLSSTEIVRGFCYRWSEDPANSGAALPTDSDSSIFSTNLTSPTLIIPKRPIVKLPSVIPVDPRDSSIKFPGVKVSAGSGRIQACFFENDGSVLNGSHGTPAATQNLRFGSTGATASKTNSSSASNFTSVYATVAGGEALSVLNKMSVTRINGTKFSPSRNVLVRLAPYLGPDFATDCIGTQSGSSVAFTTSLFPTTADDYLVQLKPIKLTQIRSFVVMPKNGRQNN